MSYPSIKQGRCALSSGSQLRLSFGEGIPSLWPLAQPTCRATAPAEKGMDPVESDPVGKPDNQLSPSKNPSRSPRNHFTEVVLVRVALCRSVAVSPCHGELQVIHICRQPLNRMPRGVAPSAERYRYRVNQQPTEPLKNWQVERGEPRHRRWMYCFIR